MTGMAAIVLLVTLSVIATWLWNQRPDLDCYSELLLQPAEPGTGLKLRHFGVTTLIIQDGETTIIVDGFFSRPPLRKVLLGRLTPDLERIRRTLEDARVMSAAAVIPLHTHYEHALDSAEVARRTGAILVGSESAAQLGRGAGLAEDRLEIVSDRRTLTIGHFEITLIPTEHLPGGPARGSINQPLSPPAHALSWREGTSFSLIVAHPEGRLLIQGGGFVAGQLAGEVVDVALIGTSGQARQSPDYQADYWRHVVLATAARRVIPVHWDDFTRPLDQGLQPFPRWIADFDRAMRDLRMRAQQHGVEVRMLPAKVAVDPFTGLGSDS